MSLDRPHRPAEPYASSILDAVPVAIVCKDTSGRAQMLNEHGRVLLGMEAGSGLGDDWFDRFVPVEERDAARAGFERYVAGIVEGRTVDDVAEYRVTGADGRSRLVRWRRSVVFDDGRIVSVLSAGEDVTERRRIEERLAFESYLLDNIHDSIIVHADEKLLYVNSSAARMRGMTKQQLLSLRFSDLQATEYRGTTYADRDRLFAKGNIRFETGHRAADGRTLLMEVHAALIEYEGRPAVASIARDITERRAAEAEIRRKAFHDSLTGVANPVLFHDRLEQAIARERRHERPMALLFIDFDRFKDVNDTYGHSAGDKLLKVAAERISARVRAGDTVARLGGDEFAVVLGEVQDKDDAERLARALLREFERPIELSATTLTMGVSIGVAFVPRAALNAEEIT